MPEKAAVKKRGNRFGIWIFKTIIRITGIRGAYGLLYLVCGYYVCFDRSARHVALSYVNRRFPGLRWDLRLHKVYKLFVSQGKNLVDRHALVAGVSSFDIQIKGYDKIEALDPNQGFVLLTSHTGNWQVVMDALKKMNRSIHLLMRPEDNIAVHNAMKVDAENEWVNVISPDRHLGGVISVMKALEQGDIVSIMGDRTYGADGVAVDFLGEPALFPYSAFQFAASAKCPVALLLSSKTGASTYSVEIAEVFHPTMERRSNRREQFRDWVQKYARILECYLEQHPYQYFIFHDIWEEVR